MGDGGGRKGGDVAKGGVVWIYGGEDGMEAGEGRDGFSSGAIRELVLE